MSYQIPPENILAWVERHFEVKLRKGGTELNICNPFDGDSNFKFSIGAETGFCHDWRGDTWAGPITKTGKRNCSFIHFVQLYLGCGYREALRDVLGSAEAVSKYKRALGRSEPTEVTEKPLVSLPPGAAKLEGTGKLATMLFRWLGGRGVTPDDIAKYDIHHLGAEVIWPYYEFGALVYWQARSRLNKRFRFPPERETSVTKGEFFYGFDQVEPAKYVVIVEAIFGVFSIRDQCLASGGAALTPRQVRKIGFLGPREGIILAPDNDQAGIKSIIQNAELLMPLGCKLLYSLPPRLEFRRGGETQITKDWNELTEHLRLNHDQILGHLDSGLTKITAKEITRLRHTSRIGA